MCIFEGFQYFISPFPATEIDSLKNKISAFLETVMTKQREITIVTKMKSEGIAKRKKKRKYRILDRQNKNEISSN